MISRRLLYLLLLVFVLLNIGLIYIYFNINQSISQDKQTSSTANFTSNITSESTPPLLSPFKATPDITQAVELPYDYEIASVSSDEVLLSGETGQMYLTKDPNIYIFRGYPPDETPAEFSDLVLGAKIRLRKIHGVAAWVYILD